MKKSVFDLNENVAGLLSYFLLFISGIAVLVLEKENRTVRFHALQSTLWFLLLFIVRFILNLMLGWIPVIGVWPGQIILFIMFVSWLFLMFLALAGKKFKIPIIGAVAEAQVNK